MKTLRVSFAGLVLFCLSQALICPVSADVRIQQKLLPTPEGKVQMLTVDDGSVIYGRIVTVERDTVVFRTRHGSVRLPISSVRGIKDVSSRASRNGAYWAPNPNGSRLLFAPTGRLLKKGEGYVADHMLFFPSVTVGVTDRVTIGGGLSIFPGVGFQDQLMYFNPKVGLSQSESFNLATGAFLVRAPADEDFDGGGLAAIYYGVATTGTPDRHVTAGLGYGTADGSGQAILMIGGESRVSRRISFITENWFFGEQPLISYGFRLIGEKMTVDFAFINTIGDGAILPGFPYIDFVFSFGR